MLIAIMLRLTLFALIVILVCLLGLGLLRICSSFDARHSLAVAAMVGDISMRLAETEEWKKCGNEAYKTKVLDNMFLYVSATGEFFWSLLSL